MTTNANRLISGVLGPFPFIGCIRSGAQSTEGEGSYKLKVLPGITPEVTEKKPKYRLYCASDLSSLKSPGPGQLVRELDSLEADTNIDISDSSKVTDSSHCLIDVALSDKSQESQFKWIAKGANGSPMTGIFYRSTAVKPSGNTLSVNLFRTYELASAGTLDIFAKATFPENTPAKDLKEASLSCGSNVFKSIAATPETNVSTVSNLTFSASKTPFSGKVTSCSLKATIGNDSFSVDGVKVEPKTSDSKVTVTVTLSKVQNDPKTMTIETSIK